MKQPPFDKFFSHSLLVLFVVVSSNAFSFDYFNKSIEYWDKREPRKAPEVKPENKTDRKEKANFDWKKTLDPMDESLEFFREGDHVPPKAYIEMFRNPNDENIDNWFKLMRKKNELVATLQKRMQEYVSKNQIPQPIVSEYTQTSENLAASAPPVPIDQYRLRLYFHSKCPHCRRMLVTMKELSSRGFFIDVRQIDNDKKALGSVPFPVVQASEQELKEKDISSWPVLLVANLKSKVIYRINGYQSAQSIIDTLGRTP